MGITDLRRSKRKAQVGDLRQAKRRGAVNVSEYHCVPQSLPIAGRLQYFLSQWMTITKDAWVLDTISHCHIEFRKTPIQKRILRAIAFSETETRLIDATLEKGAIEQVTDRKSGTFISNIFLRPKKDGSMRPIINLKELNKFVKYHHFKMETLKCALTLLRPNSFLASIDLKDAYFTIPMAGEHR